MATTYMIEGEWSGYRSEQRRIVHREYTTSVLKAETCREFRHILYTDGTTLNLRVVEQEPTKDKPEIDGYGNLIADCVRHNVNSVAKLVARSAPVKADA